MRCALAVLMCCCAGCSQILMCRPANVQIGEVSRPTLRCCAESYRLLPLVASLELPCLWHLVL